MSSKNEIKKEDLINQFELLKKSSDESYKNQNYSSLTKLTMAMIELYKIIMIINETDDNITSSCIEVNNLNNFLKDEKYKNAINNIFKS